MRNNGLLAMSANYEPQISAPLDGRLKVALYSDLTDATVWLANDGSSYTYKGMMTVVTDDVEAKNGIYILKGDDVSIASNWEKVGSGGGSSNGLIEKFTKSMTVDYAQSSTPTAPAEDGKKWLKMDGVNSKVMSSASGAWVELEAVTSLCIYIYNAISYYFNDDTNQFIVIATGNVTTGNAEEFPTGTVTSSAHGGLPANLDISGKTPVEVLVDILCPELFQSVTTGIVGPSVEFSITPNDAYQEVGTSITVVKSKQYKPGLVSPQYKTAAPVRGGSLIAFNETGPEGAYTVALGANTWTCSATYGAGPEVKGSKGTPHPSLLQKTLPAGTTNVVTRTITGVYPVYATTVDINTMTMQPLQAMGTPIQVNFVKEPNESVKQVIKIPAAWGTITKASQYDTNNGKWISIAMDTFTDPTNEDINGVLYKVYTNIAAKIGARKVEFSV